MSNLNELDIVEEPAAVTRDVEGVVTGTIHVVKGAYYGYPLWSQRDPRWKDDQLGYGGLTLGSHGCLVTALSMALTKELQQTIYPSTLNSELKKIGGFVPNSGNLRFHKVSEVYPPFQFVEKFSFVKDPAPTAEMSNWMIHGDTVVVEIDMDVRDPDVDQHWLLLVGGTADQFVYHDPWPVPDKQESFTLPPGYCKQGWTPARAIYAYARYATAK